MALPVAPARPIICPRLTTSQQFAAGDLDPAYAGALLAGLRAKGETAEEIRAQILQQLAEQGFGGDAHVDVFVDEAAGETRIDVELIGMTWEGTILTSLATSFAVP